MAYDPFGGGGGGGFEEYFSYLRHQEENLKQTADREQARASATSSMRRNDLLDRTGFAGLVNVGPAQRRSDSTLARDIAALDPTDPQRVAYNDAIAAEAERTTKSTRVLTGEQYRAEDAFADIQDKLDRFQMPGFEDKGAASAALSGLRSDVEKLMDQYNWWGDDSLLKNIDAKLAGVSTVRPWREDFTTGGGQ